MVHHRVPWQVQTRRPGLAHKDEPGEAGNHRGLPSGQANIKEAACEVRVAASTSSKPTESRTNTTSSWPPTKSAEKI
eukprot:5224432-Heterocapsa_arctica.AAC.1